jgi:hypothetical protein
MSANKYKPHVVVLPEDDANRQLANGFLTHPVVPVTHDRYIAGGRPLERGTDAFR